MLYSDISLAERKWGFAGKEEHKGEFIDLLKFVESYRKINKESPEDVSQLTVEHLRKMVDAMEEGSQYHEKFMADAMKEIEK